MLKRTMLLLSVAAVPATALATRPPPSARPAQSQTSSSTQQRPLDPQATRILRRMSDYMAGLQSFRVETEAADEVVLTSGQKLQNISQSRVSVRRPGEFRTDRIGPLANVSLIDDGHRFAIVGARTGMYATAPAPPTIDAAVDAARARLGIEAPGADLLSSNPYRTLMEDTQSGQYIGREPIEGVACDHLAFHTPDVDWQIWIQNGAQPLPRRFVITSTHETGQPEFALQLRRWEPDANLRADLFRFTPPRNGVEIGILGPSGEVNIGRGGGPR